MPLSYSMIKIKFVYANSSKIGRNLCQVNAKLRLVDEATIMIQELGDDEALW